MPAHDSGQDYSLEEILNVIGGKLVSPVGSRLTTIETDGKDEDPRVIQFEFSEIQAYLSQGLKEAFGRNPSKRHRREILELFGTNLDEFLSATFPIGDPVIIDGSGMRLAQPVPEAFDDVVPETFDEVVLEIPPNK